MVGVVGELDGDGEGPWDSLCNGGSKLGTDFVAAWESVRDAAGRPDSGPLADGAEHAGNSFLCKEAMRWGGEHASAPEPEDPEDKVKEQKQITTEIEDHTGSELRGKFAGMHSKWSTARIGCVFGSGASFHFRCRPRRIG